MSAEIRVLSSERGHESWDDFVSDLEGASFCHLSSWREIVEKAYGLQCHYLYRVEGQTLTGVLPLVHVRGPLAPNRLVSVPFLDQGGVLARSSQAAESLLYAGLELARKEGARGIDLRFPSPEGNSDIGGIRRYRFVVRLPASPETLWKSLGPKVRNQIRKAERSELSTRLVAADKLGDFYRVFSRNMRDLGSPTHSQKFFRLMAESLEQRFSLYLTTAADGKIVAGAIAIRFGETVSVPWASSDRSARSQCPNHSFYWRILQDSIDAGASEFDFGRSTQGAGTFLFKKQWSTEIRPLGWKLLDREGATESDYLLDARRNSLLSRGWSALPVPVATAIGPWIRRQLPN